VHIYLSVYQLKLKFPPGCAAGEFYQKYLLLFSITLHLVTGESPYDTEALKVNLTILLRGILIAV